LQKKTCALKNFPARIFLMVNSSLNFGLLSNLLSKVFKVDWPMGRAIIYPGQIIQQDWSQTPIPCIQVGLGSARVYRLVKMINTFQEKP
jgi:hypothetical protein